MKLKINLTTFAMLTCLALFLGSCKKEKSETELDRDFRRLDAFLRTRQFDYDSLKIYLHKIEENLIHAEDKQVSYEVWKTLVSYKWNSDSSLVFIYASKTFPVGFSREVIIHSGDSVLFIHRFSTEPLGLQNRVDYTFLESIYYLAEMRTLKHLDRIEYLKRDLKDTIAFRNKLFADLTDSGSNYYSQELNHSRNILTLN
jgi:hypothetical protein